MKIFDFTNGVKGNELDNIRRPGGLHGWFIGGTPEATERVKSIGRYTFQKGGDYGMAEDKLAFDMDTIREKFGVDAICWCAGAYIENGQEVWEWHYTATREWLENKNLVEIINQFEGA